MKTLEQIQTNQEKQEAFLYKLADRVLAIEYKYQGNFSVMPYISLTCNTCKHSNDEKAKGDSGWCLHTAEGAIQWLHHHWNHDTWVEYMGTTK